MKNILWISLIIGLVVAAILGTRYYYTIGNSIVEIKHQVMLEKIKKVAKLVTVEGYFSEIYDHQEYWGYDLSPFRKKALIRVKAKVSIGYDMEQMQVTAQPDRKVIQISNLPDPEIISIDHDLDYYDITQGSFSAFTEEDYNKMNRNAKELVRKEAMDSDLFNTAEAQGNEVLEIIRIMVESMGWELEFVPRVDIRANLDSLLR